MVCRSDLSVQIFLLAILPELHALSQHLPPIDDPREGEQTGVEERLGSYEVIEYRL
jgi:hypothetical protein